MTTRLATPTYVDPEEEEQKDPRTQTFGPTPIGDPVTQPTITPVAQPAPAQTFGPAPVGSTAPTVPQTVTQPQQTQHTFGPAPVGSTITPVPTAPQQSSNQALRADIQSRLAGLSSIKSPAVRRRRRHRLEKRLAGLPEDVGFVDPPTGASRVAGGKAGVTPVGGAQYLGPDFFANQTSRARQVGGYDDPESLDDDYVDDYVPPPPSRRPRQQPQTPPNTTQTTTTANNNTDPRLDPDVDPEASEEEQQQQREDAESRRQRRQEDERRTNEANRNRDPRRDNPDPESDEAEEERQQREHNTYTQSRPSGGGGGAGGSASINSTNTFNIGGGGISEGERARLQAAAMEALRGLGLGGRTDHGGLTREMRFENIDATETGAEGVNDQLVAALTQALRGLPGFRGVGAGSGELGEDFGAARGELDRANVGEFSPINLADFGQTDDLFSRSEGVLPGDFEFGDTTNLASQIAQQQLRGIGQGPNRFDLAARELARAREEREPIFQRQLRDVGKKAAALGRIGAGMTTNDLTDVLSKERGADRRYEEALLDRALSGTIEDRRADLGAVTGTGEAFAGVDLNRAGLKRGIAADLRDLGSRRQALTQQEFSNEQGERDRAQARDSERANLALARSGQRQSIGQAGLDEAARSRGEQRLERDTRFGQAAQRAASNLDAMRAGTDLSNTLAAQTSGLRGERRQERAYAEDLNREALENRIRQQMIEEEFKDSQFQRALDRARLQVSISNIGTGAGDLTSALMG